MNAKNCQNKHIECTVTSCANHCTDGSSYCGLDKICVGKQGTGNTSASTDCTSFVNQTSQTS
ncbi:MAG: DUF1540 domain-containing protein [Oscillospiraceae bacterium]|nr:DUF1540 domain-containing protein [Oscillospiraceae bacterium]